MSLKIRRAEKKDVPVIHSLTLEAFSRYSSEVGRSVKAMKETENDIISDINNKNVLVATYENEIIGCIRYQIIKNIAYISRFCTSPAAKLINVGKTMIDYVKEECSVLGINALCLHTSTKLTGLVKFYYKCGFYVYDVNRDNGYPRGLFVCNLTGLHSDYIELTKDV